MSTIGDSVRAPTYDPEMGAWMLSRYADVAAALADSRLSGGGDTGSTGAHVAMRDAARRAFSPARFAEWQTEMASSARDRAARLNDRDQVDLVQDFAAPWSLSVAALVTGVSEEEAPRLSLLAHEVFMAAAHATDTEVSPAGSAASAELAQAFAAETRAASIHVQAFVALSQTLPCLLGAAWLALLEHPDGLARLRVNRDLMPRAVEELLRFAGPSRAVFRRAVSDVQVGDAFIRSGDRVVLLLSAANRDGARFTDPDRLDLSRDAAGHLAFGRGTHFCAGASLIRAAVTIATSSLLSTTAAELVGDVEWIDGFAIRGPASLPVRLG